MSEPYVAQIMVFAFNFAPRNWAFCNGAVLPISQNEVLFSLVGTTYGGNGTTTFALPNLQDSGVMNLGQGPGLSNYILGEHSGVPTVTLTANQLPTHNHMVNVTGAPTRADYELAPGNGYWIGNRADSGELFATATDGSALAPQTISVTGGSLPHDNQQPYLGMNYCIALSGIYPSRN
jgi:microcystin-dependent protein